MPVEVNEICALVGEDTIRKMVAAFYRRVPSDPILGPMYPQQDFAGAEARLAGFLVYRLGGSQDYIAQRGHPRLGMRHMPFKITPTAGVRWFELMSAAMAEVNLPADAVETLNAFFRHTAAFLVNHEA